MKTYRKLAEDKDNDILEKLAEIEHEQWMGWSKDIAKTEDISEERADHWKKDCWKPYKDLTEEMKELDRKEARKVLKIIKENE